MTNLARWIVVGLVVAVVVVAVIADDNGNDDNGNDDGGRRRKHGLRRGEESAERVERTRERLEKVRSMRGRGEKKGPMRGTVPRKGDMRSPTVLVTQVRKAISESYEMCTAAAISRGSENAAEACKVVVNAIQAESKRLGKFASIALREARSNDEADDEGRSAMKEMVGRLTKGAGRVALNDVIADAFDRIFETADVADNRSVMEAARAHFSAPLKAWFEEHTQVKSEEE